MKQTHEGLDGERDTMLGIDKLTGDDIAFLNAADKFIAIIGGGQDN